MGKVSANSCEAIFDEFVTWFGGEHTGGLLDDEAARPRNADYLFFERQVVAELKCLQKDFFGDEKLGEKGTKLLGSLLRAGKIPASCIHGNNITIPQELAPRVVELFMPPLKRAISSANDQIKQTKARLGLVQSKGLLILVNERNSSLTPALALHIVGRLLQRHYSAICSVVYVVPTMQVEGPGIPEPANLWVSGYVKSESNGVSSDLLALLEQGWRDFLEQKFGHGIRDYHVDDHRLIDNLGLRRD